ncbi:MAG: cellulase family glycosylhydrolase [Sphingobacteriales bacterium]|nr:cellulase family glycosylhydrolase [Sphingobacteriales bacterium]
MKISLYLILLVSFVLFSCNKDTGNVFSDKLLYAASGSHPGIYDQSGRYVILRGVNYNSLGDYWQGNPNVPAIKEYNPEDIRMMASYGFNCIRLLFSWSKLEPERGKYNYDYIRQLKNVIEEAAKYDIYILLDMHQDAWGKYIATPQDVNCEKPNKGWDGAPQWATITDGASTCTADGSRESAPAVSHAFQNFWDNTDNIQDACISAWAVLVKETAKYGNVVGYDLLNEPGLGYKPLNEEARKLSTYYGKCIRAIRSAERDGRGLEHIIFFEMSITWNGQPVPFIPYPDFTEDKNIIFAPHTYFEAISYILTIEQGLDLLRLLSGIYKTGLFIGEWGFFGNPADDVSKVKRFCKKEDEYLITGSTWWQWAQAPGDPHGMSWDGTQYANTSMHLIELDVNGNFTGNKNDYYLKVLSRTRPVAIFGKPFRLESNPDDGTMQLEAKATGTGISTLWIPDRFGVPAIAGDNILSSKINKVDGGYFAEISVSGTYRISISF